MSVSVQESDFDPGAEIAAMTAGRRDLGAVATFVGLVRGGDDMGSIGAMTLEHYPAMTAKALEAIETEARTRWPVSDVRIVHRVGRLLPGERIVFVGVAGRHRGEAFAACEFVMDYLKTRAPFWKKEETEQGTRWVEALESDDAAADRWKPGAPR